MYEVEVKIPAGHRRVRDRLEKLGAETRGAVTQEDTYYNAPHREFAETDEALRVRHESPADGESRAYLTYKGPLVDEESKTREEFETAVENGTVVDELLARLGFDPAATVRKNRELYTLDGYTVTLDAVEGLGEFVEVETETETGVDKAREGAFDVLGRLGLDPENGVRRSYLALLLAGDDPE